MVYDLFKALKSSVSMRFLMSQDPIVSIPTKKLLKKTIFKNFCKKLSDSYLVVGDIYSLDEFLFSYEKYIFNYSKLFVHQAI